MKVVINKCYGGFGLSKKALAKLRILECFKSESYFKDNRDNLALVKMVKDQCKDVNGRHANLKVIDIPDGVSYTIEEYDGLEWIAEKHRTWA